MPDPVAPPQAAPVASSNAPVTPPVAESVKRFNSTAAATPAEENSKGFRSLDDAFEKHFKHLAKSTPSEAEEAFKSKGKPETKDSEPKAEPKSEPKEEAKQEESKSSKIIDPETLTPGKDVKSKEAQANWKQLNDNSKRINAENKKLSDKIKDLEAVVASKGGATQKEIETYKAKIEEYRPYREMFDLQHDPDFRKAYDEPMVEKKAEMMEIFKGINANVDEKAMFDILGDFSPNIINQTVKYFRDGGNETQAEDFKTIAREIQTLKKNRDKALGNAKEKFSEFSKNREQTTLAKKTEEEAVINQTVQNAYQTKNQEGVLEIPFFNMREMPENATKDQMTEVENHNKMAEQLQNHVQQTLAANDPESRAFTAVRAVVGAVRDAQLKGALQRIHELEGELKKISSSSSEKRNVSPAKSSNGSSTAASVEASMETFFANRRR